ncbi:MAG TPA: hypothetical protein PKE55_07680 [Kiritimatiellia bacterium]|nr:hypothetical protein [Kiritimatiellia bacterium]
MSLFDAERYCPDCRRDRLVVKKPVYDGFTRIGERVVCTGCGRVFEEGELTPARSRAAPPSVFGEDDRPVVVKVFAEGENRTLCRYCKNYIVNPFRQWCSHHKKDVEATDTCGDFMAVEGEDTPEPSQGKGADI